VDEYGVFRTPKFAHKARHTIFWICDIRFALRTLSNDVEGTSISTYPAPGTFFRANIGYHVTHLLLENGHFKTMAHPKFEADHHDLEIKCDEIVLMRRARFNVS
jgi:hypothetical protein